MPGPQAGPQGPRVARKGPADRARPTGARGGLKGPAHKSPGRPTRARSTMAQVGPQGLGPQGPRGAHEGPTTGACPTSAQSAQRGPARARSTRSQCIVALWQGHRATSNATPRAPGPVPRGPLGTGHRAPGDDEQFCHLARIDSYLNVLLSQPCLPFRSDAHMQTNNDSYSSISIDTEQH